MTAAFCAAALMVAQAFAAIPASAHHGWGTFDTTKAFYIHGIVTDVRWGNPTARCTCASRTRTCLPGSPKGRFPRTPTRRMPS
ncbi:DUF6152 family protein [Rhizobium ruizarguesonis]|uniref:DUF6152 family protein n=1 Tax=Rhizobium ruizarguesonis TaxID=2081791 RepID=UPI0013BF56EA|nr:DUF6152 family protein [Rhizobium ruizarguesonis]NEI96484.1 hypothetical protein [Rhizobium ruizarguesonis]NEJ33893.1 hypothetical protein [Rhizobium ruizarguesonis]